MCVCVCVCVCVGVWVCVGVSECVRHISGALAVKRVDVRAHASRRPFLATNSRY